MKVAVMGAGLSGLACAIRLEQMGVSPTVFEKRSCPGDRFANMEALISVFSRPIRDEIAFLADRYQIYLQPSSNISEFVIRSANEKAVLTGNLGFCNHRGRQEDAWENQLARQVKSKIHFHAEQSYEHLLKEFTHVVVATGDPSYTAAVHNFRTDFTATLKGATVEGEFSRYRVISWLDDRFAPKGYGYLLPFTEKLANIVIAFREGVNDDGLELKEKWALFFDRVCTDLGQDLQVTDQFEVNGYKVGQCRRARVGNTFFTGNCLDSVMPLFGFGQFPAILSGIYAAEDLCGGTPYIEATRAIHASYDNSMVIRKLYERLDTGQKDRLVKMLNGKMGEKLLTTRFDVLKIASRLLRWTGIQ
ncbi:NAD(P)/FAD-dependent oxidoreductase [Paenibacillus sanfengchensis]|uniref:NAD(P)/FAD-dependent oxidoreductase n=1 Tax=Paenibacillus sanfengchensis TaxID=3119819 RepID=UPI002FE33E56